MAHSGNRYTGDFEKKMKKKTNCVSVISFIVNVHPIEKKLLQITPRRWKDIWIVTDGDTDTDDLLKELH